MSKKENNQHPQPRGIFFKNYDLYETEGVDGPAKQGPGTGFYSNMGKYKSVSDFLNKKRKIQKRKLAFLQIIASIDLDENMIVDHTEDQTTTIPYQAEPATIGLYDNMYPRQDLVEEKPIVNQFSGRIETHNMDYNNQK